MNLYEIDRGILACVDADTGEVIDPEMLDALMMERTSKVESVALWIKNLESDVLALKAEKDAFADREAKAKKKIESLKKWLVSALEGEAFNTTKCAVAFRKSTKLKVLDECRIPSEFMVTTVTAKPDANAIKALLKHGVAVEGCAIEENMNVQIL